MKLLVVFMKSRYSIYQSHLKGDAHSPQLKKFLEETPDGEHLLRLDRANSENLEKLLEALDKSGIYYNFCYRACLSKNLVNSYDYIMAVGGDGTFLETADYIKDSTPIIGFNSAVYYDDKLGRKRGSEGAYCAIDSFNFDEKIKLFLEEKLPITAFNRLAVEYNNEKLEHLVLNEVSVGPGNPHRCMGYGVRTKNFEESQSSSGLLIAVPGNPWSLTYPGASVLQTNEKIFQVVTRANYNSSYNLEKGEQKTDGIIIKHPNWVEIESKDRTATIALDGEHKQYAFGFGDKIKVYLSDKPLNIVGYDTERRDKYYNIKREPVIRKVE